MNATVGAHIAWLSSALWSSIESLRICGRTWRDKFMLESVREVCDSSMEYPMPVALDEMSAYDRGEWLRVGPMMIVICITRRWLDLSFTRNTVWDTEKSSGTCLNAKVSAWRIERGTFAKKYYSFIQGTIYFSHRYVAVLHTEANLIEYYQRTKLSCISNIKAQTAARQVWGRCVDMPTSWVRRNVHLCCWIWSLFRFFA